MRTDNTVPETKSVNSLPKERDKSVFKELLTSNLDFKASSNNGYDRYYWHAFPAKFPSEIPRLFIENLTTVKDLVLDPMAGSCTTLLEAAFHQRNSIKKVMQLKEKNVKKGKVLHRYYFEMSQVIKEMYRVLKPGRACVIVVASSVLCGLDVETQNCLAEIGQQHGFELVHIGERNIDRNKRMLPTSHFKNPSQIETRMHNEYVLGFWKPFQQQLGSRYPGYHGSRQAPKRHKRLTFRPGNLTRHVASFSRLSPGSRETL